MLDYIDAPMPYIIGIRRELWKTARRTKTLPPDVSVFDLDKDAFECHESLPEFPHDLSSHAYIDLAQSVKVRADTGSEEDDEESWVRSGIVLKLAAAKFLAELLGGELMRFYRGAAQRRDSPRNVFGYEEYCEKGTPFVKELGKTQGFMVFVERANRARRDRNDLFSFVMCLETLAAGGEKGLAEHLAVVQQSLFDVLKHVIFLSKKIVAGDIATRQLLGGLRACLGEEDEGQGREAQVGAEDQLRPHRGHAWNESGSGDKGGHITEEGSRLAASVQQECHGRQHPYRRQDAHKYLFSSSQRVFHRIRVPQRST